MRCFEEAGTGLKLPHMEVNIGPQWAGMGRQLPTETMQPVARSLLGDKGFVGLFATGGDGVEDRLRERTVQGQSISIKRSHGTFHLLFQTVLTKDQQAAVPHRPEGMGNGVGL